MRTTLLELFVDHTTRRGALGPFKLVAKSVRLAAHWRAHRRWVRCLERETSRQLLATRPRIAYRACARYLFRGACFRTRMAMLHAHYTFLNDVCDAAGFAKILGPDGFKLWSLEACGSCMTIHLNGPPHHREGDLELHFKVDGVVVFRLAFSVLSDDIVTVQASRDAEPPCPVIYIGQVQGAVGEVARIRLATRLCAAVAPQDLLMNAVSGIAQAWNIARLYGVGIDRQLAADKMSQRSPHFDYETFWRRYRSTPNADRHHVVDMPFVPRPMGEIVTRHRKRTVHKRRFKEAVTRRVMLRVATHLSAHLQAKASPPACIDAHRSVPSEPTRPAVDVVAPANAP